MTLDWADIHEILVDNYKVEAIYVETFIESIRAFAGLGPTGLRAYIEGSCDLCEGVGEALMAEGLLSSTFQPQEELAELLEMEVRLFYGPLRLWYRYGVTLEERP